MLFVFTVCQKHNVPCAYMVSVTVFQSESSAHLYLTLATCFP